MTFIVPFHKKFRAQEIILRIDVNKFMSGLMELWRVVLINPKNMFVAKASRFNIFLNCRILTRTFFATYKKR